MTSKYTNKNGVKLLVAVLAFAMVACALVITTPDANAEKAIADPSVKTETSVASLTVDGTVTYYDSLVGAVAAAPSKQNSTITLLKDSAGDGVKIVEENKTIVFDFAGFTYTVGEPVGSPGTVSQGFHIEKTNTITMKNGTIANSGKVSMLFQNYCDLTLIDMKLDGTKMSAGYDVVTGEKVCNYTLSLNNGSVSILGNTQIIADEGQVAFDVCWGPNVGYPNGTQVTLNTTGSIDGDIMIDDWGTSDNKSLSTLTILSGIINGDVLFTSQYGTEVHISEGVVVDVLISKSSTVSGTVSFGDNEVSFDSLKTGNNVVKLSEGSVAIEGDFNVGANGSVVITGTAKLTGDVTITEEASITIKDGAQLIIDEGYTLEVEGTATVNGKIVNDGLIISKEPLQNVEGNTPAVVPGNGQLILDGYSGTNPISGEYNDVVLNGDNVITIDDAKDVRNIISLVDGRDSNGNPVNAKIHSIDGNGTLTIILKGVTTDVVAIDAAGALDIDGVSITIVISAADGFEDLAYGIKVENVLTAFGSTISIDCVNGYENSAGISAGGIELRSTNIKVIAGVAIICGDVISLAEAEVDATGEYIAIFAYTGINATISSVINAEKTGSENGTFAIISGYLNTTSGATVNTNSMDITSGLNNATIIISGDVVISGAYENKATFTSNGDMVISGTLTNSAGTFTNNGIIGVYGKLENAGGEFVNNGEINTYGYEAGYVENPIIFSNSNRETVTLGFSDVTALADGTLSVIITITTYDGPDFIGTIKIDGDTMIIDAKDVGKSVTITVTYNEARTEVEKYSITVTSEQFKATNKDVPNNNKDGLLALKGLIDPILEENEQTINVSGGKVTNNGTIAIEVAQNTFVTGGSLINAGEIYVNKNITIEGGALSGDAITLGDNVIVTLTGDVDTSFVFAGEYTYTDSNDASITAAYDNEIAINGDCKGVVFSTSVIPEDEDSVVSITLTKNAAETDKKVTVTLVKGFFYAADTTVEDVEYDIFADGVIVEVLADVVLEANGNIVVGNGVLAAQDGSILNIWGETEETWSFGKLTYEISFVKKGYTYYGNIAYALANAAEGMTLTLNGTPTITSDLTVGKGVTLQFAKGATLTIGNDAKDIKVVMLEGASFVFTDAFNTVNITNDTKTVQFSGTIVYDGNTVVLDKVPMIDENIIGCTVADRTTVSDIKVTLGTIKSGTVTAEAGKVALKAVFSADTTKKTASKLVVAENATISDLAENKVISLAAGSSAQIDGTLMFLANTTISATVSGNGNIVADDNKAITFNGTIAQNIAVANKGLTDKVVLKNLVANDKDASPATNNTVVITSKPKVGTTAAYVQVSGTYYSGEISAVGNVAIDDLTVSEKAVFVVPVGSTVTVKTDSDANGLVKVAGKIIMDIDGDSTTTSYGKLKYDITYEDDGYTVYTVIGTAIENASAGDSFTLQKDFEINGTQEIPSGVTIVVPEDYKIIVSTGDKIVIGSGITTLGAVGGIVGTIELSGTGYVIDYADASMSGSDMEIVSGTDDKVVNNRVTVLNQVYATIYALDGAVALINEGNLDVLKDVVPEIDGYRFVQFDDVFGEKLKGTVNVGSMDVIAEMLADQVKVTFTYVDGIIYYVNGEQKNIIGAPVYVDYGAIITAGKVPGYEGTPLVNGETYVTVTGDMTITGSFSVSPVTPTYNVYLVNGTEVIVQNIKDGETAVEPTAPVKDGYRFVGWFNGDVAYDFTAPVTQDIVLVAVFEQIIPEPEPATPSTGFDVYAKVVDGDIQFRIISQDGYIEDGTFSITLYYTYYDSFVGDYMTDKFVDPVGYTSDESEDVTFTYTIPTDKTYYSASAVFTSGLLKDETGTIFI